MKHFQPKYITNLNLCGRRFFRFCSVDSCWEIWSRDSPSCCSCHPHSRFAQRLIEDLLADQFSICLTGVSYFAESRLNLSFSSIQDTSYFAQIENFPALAAILGGNPVWGKIPWEFRIETSSTLQWAGASMPTQCNIHNFIHGCHILAHRRGILYSQIDIFLSFIRNILP